MHDLKLSMSLSTTKSLYDNASNSWQVEELKDKPRQHLEITMSLLPIVAMSCELVVMAKNMLFLFQVMYYPQFRNAYMLVAPK